MDALKSRLVPLLGVDFNNSTLQETIKRVLARPRMSRFSYIVTPNADHLERMWRIPRLRPVYKNAMLCLLDSKFIARAANFLGLPHPEVVTGADLTEALLARLNHQHVCIVGMRPQNFATLAARHPHIIFHHHQPPMDLLHNIPAFHAARDFICETHAPFTFIALGSPVQELLAYAVAATREAVGIGLCIGAALEFSAGTQRRAPLWMRRRGLEWLHRLAHNPFRLAGRYVLSDPKVLAVLAYHAIKARK